MLRNRSLGKEAQAEGLTPRTCQQKEHTGGLRFQQRLQAPFILISICPWPYSTTFSSRTLVH